MAVEVFRELISIRVCVSILSTNLCLTRPFLPLVLYR